MAVYINGLKMPKKSGVLTLRIWGNGRVERLEGYHSWLLSGVTAEQKKDKGEADVVEVVRCKDCRWHEQEQPGMVYCPNIVGGWMENECFCSMGERK